MLKIILITIAVVIGVPIILFIIFFAVAFINFLIRPEMNSSGYINECVGCPGMKNGTENWPCNECEYRPENRAWDPDLECEVLKTSRYYKRKQRKKARLYAELHGYDVEEYRYHIDKGNKDHAEERDNLQVAYEVIDGRWGNGERRKADLEKAGYDYREIQALVNEICTPKQKRSILDSIIKLFRIR